MMQIGPRFTPVPAFSLGSADELPIPPEHLAGLRSMRVVFAADCAEELRRWTHAFSMLGFSNILPAHDAAGVMRWLRSEHREGVSTIDAVVLDLRTAPSQACEVCAHLRMHEEWKDIPALVIATTGAPEQTALAALSAGATDVLFRPVRDVDLILCLASALNLKKERDLRKHRERELEKELADRRVMEARLQYLVAHDDLTGLCNRRHLEQALEAAMERGRNGHSTAALYYIDVDQFKIINDAEGHALGDRLLVSAADALRRHIGRSGVVAHIGADEFAVLIENVTEADALRTAESLRRLLQTLSFRVDDRSYQISASIGVALIRPDEPLRVSEMLTRADQACYIAKTQGRNLVHVFDRGDQELMKLRSALYWVPRIRDALAHDRFQLFFQPVLKLRDGSVSRFEVLIRMLGEGGTVIPPGQFIPVAERMGLIHDIDLWVVRHTIAMLHKLPPSRRDVSVNVNLSGRAFQDPQLVPLVREQLQATGIDPARLTFELTETAAVTSFEQTREMVIKLKELGCRFALDDFGNGFSSFNYLKQFPVDCLKIDGGFITNLAHDPVDQTLVQSMIDIARSLGKETVAEYVESEATLQLVRHYGVDYAQGYFVGKPRPSIETNELS